MKRILMGLVMVAFGILLCAGCKTHSGSREFIPGKGWVPND